MSTERTEIFLNGHDGVGIKRRVTALSKKGAQILKLSYVLALFIERILWYNIILRY